MNYREKMKEYLKEPDKYSSQYGKWAILNREQRNLIKRLLREMDSADEVIKHQYFEIERLKQEHEAIKKYVHNHTITYIDNGIECCKPDEYFNISWVEDMLNGNFENLDVLFEDSEDNE